MLEKIAKNYGLEAKQNGKRCKPEEDQGFIMMLSAYLYECGFNGEEKEAEAIVDNLTYEYYVGYYADNEIGVGNA